MSDEEIRNGLLDILGEIAPTVQVSDGEDSKRLDDLGLDSLDISGLLLGIEDKFGLKISDEDADQLKTLKDYQAYIACHT